MIFMSSEGTGIVLAEVFVFGGTIRDIILVLRLSMEYAYKERAIPLLNWDLIEYPKEFGIKKVVSLSKDQSF